MNYFLHLVIYLEIYLLVAFSLNLLLGYGGLLNIAHAAYYGLGAYAYALVTVQLGLGLVPALLGAALVPALLSLLVSLPALRLRGDGFVLMSLGVQIFLFALFYNWIEITGGPYGLAGIPRPAIGGSSYASHGSIALIYFAIVAIALLILVVLKKSPFGRALQAIRDDELAARSVGIPVKRIKLEAFATASALVGIAGALYAGYVTYIDPTSFNLDESILMLSMVIVGGTGNLIGPVVGASVLVALPEFLRLLELPNAQAGAGRLLAYGLLLVLLMLARPQGLAGQYRYD
jgi:branched-chain amino acid transport system permease protein